MHNKVLVAEPSGFVRSPISDFLRHRGLEAIGVGKVSQALYEIRFYDDFRTPFRMVIAAVDLPNEGGIELFKELRGMRRRRKYDFSANHSQTPIILLEPAGIDYKMGFSDPAGKFYLLRKQKFADRFPVDEAKLNELLEQYFGNVFKRQRQNHSHEDNDYRSAGLW